MKPLHKLNPGEKAFIVDLRHPRLSEKLLALGIFPGAMVEVKEPGPNSNCMTVHINNHDYNIYRHAAATIITHHVSLEFGLN